MPFFIDFFNRTILEENRSIKKKKLLLQSGQIENSELCIDSSYNPTY